MSIRSERDCVFLASMIPELNNNTLALLFGLLCGAYAKHPDALFWDVLAQFSIDRSRELKP